MTSCYPKLNYMRLTQLQAAMDSLGKLPRLLELILTFTSNKKSGTKIQQLLKPSALITQLNGLELLVVIVLFIIQEILTCIPFILPMQLSPK